VRRMGLGTAMIKKLGITEVYDPLPGSEPFWKAVNLYREPSIRRCEHIENLPSQSSGANKENKQHFK